MITNKHFLQLQKNLKKQTILKLQNMVTIEKNLVSTLNNEDIKTLSEINIGLNYYRPYYQRLTWFKTGLDYQEYYTLYIDFYCFYNEIHLNSEHVELYKINSFIRSFKLILKQVQAIKESPESMFRAFLEDSIVCMSVMLSELIGIKN